jgi:hypothetical protein
VNYQGGIIMSLKQCLEELIGLYNNYTLCGIEDLREQNDDKILLGEVIILLTKIQLGIKRYNTNDYLSAPKTELKRLIELEGDELKKVIPYELYYDYILSLC